MVRKIMPSERSYDDWAHHNDWAHHVTTNLESLVNKAYNFTVRPAYFIGRLVTFGIIITVLVSIASITLYIGIIRLLNIYAFNGRIWISDLLVGLFMIIIGFFLWSKRKRNLL